MANLLGQNIGTNYKGILNLDSTINTPLDTTLRAVTDGMGNASPLYLSTSQVASVFSGTGEKETYSHVLTHADADGLGAFQAVYTNTTSLLGRTGFKFKGGINAAAMQYQIAVGGTTPNLNINGSGNVAIGLSDTSASACLHVRGAAAANIAYFEIGRAHV